MWLRALAGAYAGQIRDYRMDVGMMALRSGTAERLDTPALIERITVAPVVEQVVERKPQGRAARGRNHGR